MYNLTLKLNTNYSQNKYLAKLFFYKYKVRKVLSFYAQHKLDSLHKDTRYKDLIERYRQTKSKKDKINIGKQLNELTKKFKLDKSSIYDFSKEQNKQYKNYISSQEMNAICDEVLSGIDKILYSDGEKLHIKQLNDITSISAKSLENGIKIDLKEGIIIQGLKKHYIKIPFKIKEKDLYKQECLMEDYNKIKYCKIIRKQFPNYYHYYVQLTIDSIPPNKLKIQNGTTGIDIGTQSIAIVNDKECKLLELSPKIDKYNKRIIKLQQKMERSQRINNPENYEKDGTIKKGSKFKKTNNYCKLQRKFRYLNRLKVEYKKQWNNTTANYILEKSKHGIFLEPMNFKSLQKKSKSKVEKSDKTKNIKGKQIRLNKKKRRFGKSINNKSPGSLIAILKYKSEFNGIKLYEIDRYKFKASQYNHITDTFEKKDLGTRWNNLNGDLIQRDLYSAFLIKNSNTTLDKADKSKCNKEFRGFKKLHDKEIQRIKNSNQKVLSSFGI